jgi:hypothetical protein
MNYLKKEGEDLRSDFINKIAKEKLKVTIQPDEIQAIHRIRGKEGQAPPVIVKLKNTEVKSRVMRVKKKGILLIVIAHSDGFLCSGYYF